MFEFVAKVRCKYNPENRTANSTYPDEMAHCEPSHLDLHCLPMYAMWCAGLNGLVGRRSIKTIEMYVFNNTLLLKLYDLTTGK